MYHACKNQFKGIREQGNGVQRYKMKDNNCFGLSHEKFNFFPSARNETKWTAVDITSFLVLTI